MKKFSIGNQSFIELIEDNRIYIDKTQYVYSLADDYKYAFIARPRRFGKTLFINTLKAFFEGKKELFANLQAGKLMEGKEWKKYPVLLFDFSSIDSTNVDEIKENISFKLSEYEELYSCAPKATLSDRLIQIVKAAAAQSPTGKVVLLIDEYDTPMLRAIGANVEQQEAVRQVVRSFFAPIKSLDAYWRFVYISGITQFSHVSIFSQLNNLKNISMLPEYDAICGFTLQEIEENLHHLVNKLAEKKQMSYEQTMQKLKRYYDGYKFTRTGHHIYNPFSLSNAFVDLEIQPYWYQTGTPTFLFHFMRQHKTQIMDLENVKAVASEFTVPIDNMKSAIPLLYQSGYLSIKEYFADSDMYLLSYPNKEVRAGFLQNFMQYVLDKSNNTGLMIRMREALVANDINTLLLHVKSFMAGINYSMYDKTELDEKTSAEKHFQLIIYLIIKCLTDFVDVEVQTATGRIDMLIQTRTHNYVMELKLDGTAAEALKQIHEKNYMIPYEAGDRKTVAVGIDFSYETRTLNEWVIE